METGQEPKVMDRMNEGDVRNSGMRGGGLGGVSELQVMPGQRIPCRRRSAVPPRPMSCPVLSGGRSGGSWERVAVGEQRISEAEGACKRNVMGYVAF